NPSGKSVIIYNMTDNNYLIISSTWRFLVADSSLPTALSFNNPTITSKTLFTLLHNFVSSLRKSSVSEIQYSVLLVL
ncbi:17837_t:CDS:1, partial [Rhizophagus irregularis]